MAQAYYTPMTIQTGQVPSTQTNFPCLVYLSGTRFKTIGNGGHVVTGTDIRPYSDSGLSSALTYQMEFYDGTNGIWIGWVLLASAADALVIYTGYGDASLNTDGSSTSTWPSQYKGVFHLPDGSSLSVANSSQTSISPTNHSIAAATGKIDGGGTGASSNYIDLGTVANLNLTGDLSLTAWVNTTSSALNVLIGGYDPNAPFQGYGLAMGVNSAGKMDFWCGDLVHGWAGANTTVNDGSWHMVKVTLTGTSPIFYRDGVSDGSPFATPTLGYSGPRTLFNSPGLAQAWAGSADEIHIASGVDSQDWITTEYNSQSNNSAFWALGSEVAVSAAVRVGSMFNIFF